MIDAIINGGLGLLIIAMILHKLFFDPDDLNGIERVGLGLISGGMVLTTAALAMHGTPFDDWSFNMTRVGFALFNYARLYAMGRRSRETVK